VLRTPESATPPPSGEQWHVVGDVLRSAVKP
jgi:hypothetical protein